MCAIGQDIHISRLFFPIINLFLKNLVKSSIRNNYFCTKKVAYVQCNCQKKIDT